MAAVGPALTRPHRRERYDDISDRPDDAQDAHQEPPAAHRRDRADRAHERFEVLERAAIEAELESGRREETIHKAKVHILWRMARIVAGTFVVVLGVILLALPGPGMVVVALGLGILAQDVPFARRMLERVKARLPQDADGRLPLIVWVMMVGSVVVFTAASVWMALLRL